MNERDGENRSCAGTARFIARCLEMANQDGSQAVLFPESCGEFNRQLLLAAGDRNFLRVSKSRLLRTVFLRGVDFLLPGIVPHYLARKRCLEDEVRRVCGECRQVVVLGVGLDTMAWRLHQRLSAVTFIEIDRPAALRIKKRAVTAAGADPRNLTLLPADLASETLPDVLRRSPAHDRTLPTLFLAEGLFMYLTSDRVNSLLDEVTTLNSPHVMNRLAFTFMETRHDGRIGFRGSSSLVDWWLRRGGEPFRWSADPVKIPAWLKSKGWHAREILAGDALRSRYPSSNYFHGTSSAMGECIVFAHAIHQP